MDLLVRQPVSHAMGDAHLLVDQFVGVGVVLRARDDQRVRRRAESGIDGIDLDPGGAALQQAEIADDLALDAREDEGGTGIARGIGAAGIGRGIEALADEADPRQRIWRAALAPPQPALLAGEAVVILADLGVPGAGALPPAPPP